MTDPTSATPCDFGLIGLAVMGQNLVLNLADHGYSVAVYNRTAARTDDFLAGPAAGYAAADTTTPTGRIVGTHTLQALADTLTRPRRIMLMVRAGTAVDATIDSLLPVLDPGDVIIDGGNSNVEDTRRRSERLAEAGFLFVGCGVSGGEEGARHGPSLMPGGHTAAWPLIREPLRAIAARAPDGEPCCDWIGTDGAGHYVKMVHNGIEYGDMQLIAEAYHLMRDGLGLDNAAMQAVFADWNRGELESYLVEITADILGYRENGEYVLDLILDSAGQKGTGKWTAIGALDLGVPLTLIGEAVFARYLSALKSERCRAADILTGPAETHLDGDREQWLTDLRGALYAARIASYSQGFQLLRAAAAHYDWQLDHAGIAALWRGGCIIRSAFLDDIRTAFRTQPALDNLLLDGFFRDSVQAAQAGWRRIVGGAAAIGIPVPAMSAALAYYDGYRTARLPANLLQAQRDYFGAHTYERIDREGRFHSNWTGQGGEVSSGSYEA